MEGFVWNALRLPAATCPDDAVTSPDAGDVKDMVGNEAPGRRIWELAAIFARSERHVLESRLGAAGINDSRLEATQCGCGRESVGKRVEAG